MAKKSGKTKDDTADASAAGKKASAPWDGDIVKGLCYGFIIFVLTILHIVMHAEKDVNFLSFSIRDRIKSTSNVDTTGGEETITVFTEKDKLSPQTIAFMTLFGFLSVLMMFPTTFSVRRRILEAAFPAVLVVLIGVDYLNVASILMVYAIGELIKAAMLLTGKMNPDDSEDNAESRKKKEQKKKREEAKRNKKMVLTSTSDVSLEMEEQNPLIS